MRILISGKVGRLCHCSNGELGVIFELWVWILFFSNLEQNLVLNRYSCPLSLMLSVHMKQWKRDVISEGSWICCPKWPKNILSFSVSTDQPISPFSLKSSSSGVSLHFPACRCHGCFSFRQKSSWIFISLLSMSTEVDSPLYFFKSKCCLHLNIS